MTNSILTGLSIIIVFGVGAQWLAWRLRIPSIILLLVTGVVIGPVLGLLKPDELFGDLLIPIVSLSVAVILFEGGLSLRINELTDGRWGAVLNLVSIGLVVTWLLSSLLAYLVLGLNLGIAVLFGAIIVVTGPTVTGPLLRQIRPVAKVNGVLKWEGIVIDPLAVLLSVVVLDVLLSEELEHASATAVLFIVKALGIGVALGVAFAFLLIWILKRYWVPDHLQSTVALMLAISAFTLSENLLPEAGLLTVTLMGVILANQKRVMVQRIAEFNENLRVLLIAGLFLLLAARIELADLAHFGPPMLIFLLVLVLLVRPLAVFLSTFRRGFTRNERLLMGWMAPRGIVAAAISSVFANTLAGVGYPQAELLVPLTFMVIMATVTIYGLTAPVLARRLRLANPNPQGVLIIGAHSWARAIGESLKRLGIQVLLADTNWANISTARMSGLRTYYGDVLSEQAIDKIDLSGIGRLLALTGNDELNSLAALRFAEVLSRSEVYQLNTAEPAPTARRIEVARTLLGRLLFNEEATYRGLQMRFAAGAEIKTTSMTGEYGYEKFLEAYGSTAWPLFLIKANNELVVYAHDKKIAPEPGQTLVALVDTSR